jgi:hypothetical protein
MLRSTLAAAVLVAALATSVSAQAAASTGNFRYHPAKDPITDEDRSEVSVPAVENSAAPPRLTVQCQGGGVTIKVNYLPYGDFDQPVNVTWRFDQQPPQTATWARSENEAAIADGWAPFLAAMRASRTLAVRIATPSGATLDHIYRMTGSSAALDRLQCVRELEHFTRDSIAGARP